MKQNITKAVLSQFPNVTVNEVEETYNNTFQVFLTKHGAIEGAVFVEAQDDKIQVDKKINWL